MKRTFAALLIAFIGLAAVSAYGKRRQDLTVAINKESATQGGIKVAFVELVEDARCPTDVQCVWAGNAKIKIRVTRSGRSKILELNTLDRSAVPVYAGYRFKLKSLTPEPRSNVRINRMAYAATIEISKII